MTKCVECGSHVPSYQKFLCEDCWKETLNKDFKGNKRTKEADKSGENRSRY